MLMFAFANKVWKRFAKLVHSANSDYKGFPPPPPQEQG